MTVEERLAEAKAALHALTCGQSVVRISDQNGETVIYRPPDREALLKYIADLERLVAPSVRAAGPLRFWM